MIRALLAMLARLVGRLYCIYCRRPADATHCDGCHNAPTYCVCDRVDLVPATCDGDDGCGYPLEYCCCSEVGRDLSDYMAYVAVTR